ncbi:Fibrinogen C domain-containing protein 1-A, partial [Lamellibrachia satsuma]
LAWHAGMAFSTKDRDNDVDSRHCAQLYHGGWWYKGCHHSNLNGLYLSGANTAHGKGINWYQWRGWKYSLKKVEMKLRP